MSLPPLVDLQTKAGDLARSLSSLRLFMSATQHLLDSICTLQSEILRRQGRKVVTLVEISRATLTRAGIKLHLFTSCPPTLQQYKSAYFDVLRALRERQDVFDDPTLRNRLNRLLLPLSSWLVIRRGDASSAPQLPPTLAARPSAAPYCPVPVPTTRSDHINTSRRPSPASVASMPPPSSLPSRPSIRLEPPPDPSVRMARTRSPRPQWPAPAAEDPDDENTPELVVSPILAQRSAPRRFGIFCTGANSVYGKDERRNHHRSPRSPRYS